MPIATTIRSKFRPAWRRLLPLLLASMALLHAGPAVAAHYFWDFRKGHFDNLSLVPMGPGAVNLLRPTKEGLRITVPAGFEVKSVGFSPRFLIRGDFEISLAYTIVDRTQPQSGFGTGPNLYLSMGTPQDPATSLGRLLRRDGRDIHGVFAARVEEGERIPTAKLFDVPRRSRTGRLQLKRTGEEIQYAFAADEYTPFEPLATLPVSTADVTLLRIGLQQSDAASAATILIHDLRIEATALPHLPGEQSRTAQLYRPRYQPPPVPPSTTWRWQALAAAVIAIGFAGWWRWRR